MFDHGEVRDGIIDISIEIRIEDIKPIEEVLTSLGLYFYKHLGLIPEDW